MKQTSIAALLPFVIGTWAFAQQSPSRKSGESAALASPAGQGVDEEQVFVDAQMVGTPGAYLKFYRQFPDSTRIKVTQGKVRARYWFDLTDDSKTGVLLTVADSPLILNATLPEANELNVIWSKLGKPKKPVTCKGHTFEYTRAEITSGSCYEGGEELRPTDHLGAVIICDATGEKLLAVDIKQATAAKQATTEPTYRPKPPAPAKATIPGITRSGSSGGSWILDKNVTPISQKVTIIWAQGPTGKMHWEGSFP